jgi:hypothetical protein
MMKRREFLQLCALTPPLAYVSASPLGIETPRIAFRSTGRADLSFYEGSGVTLDYSSAIARTVFTNYRCDILGRTARGVTEHDVSFSGSPECLAKLLEWSGGYREFTVRAERSEGVADVLAGVRVGGYFSGSITLDPLDIFYGGFNVHGEPLAESRWAAMAT